VRRWLVNRLKINLESCWIVLSTSVALHLVIFVLNWFCLLLVFIIVREWGSHLGWVVFILLRFWSCKWLIVIIRNSWWHSKLLVLILLRGSNLSCLISIRESWLLMIASGCIWSWISKIILSYILDRFIICCTASAWI
jgi:hypothetical protein